MANAEAVIRARIDSGVKDRAGIALEAMGLSFSDAVRLLMVRIAEEQRLPFEVKVPNKATLKAFRELESGKGTRFETAQDLFDDLGI
ncbi:MAG: type II toxin-antitoxin system RelB/DinJ family antitoxin [Gammaproteobacteria bacterium]|nr:type II toxin-antitoxin system RelB/DinJ family antitoxin [Gammaproteobacteria bacterium]